MKRPEEAVKDPEMRQLLKSLKQMPQYLIERSRKIEERREFVRRVWEPACKAAFGNRKVGE